MTRPADPRSGKTHDSVTARGSALARYQSVIVGRRGLLHLLYFEWCVWLSYVPGALGLLLRKLFWPRLLGSCGKGVQFGTNITLMHPHRIHLGERTVIGNGCILDGRNPTMAEAIKIDADTILSHGVMLSAKDGGIVIGHNVGIGPYTVVQAAEDWVYFGNHVIVAAQCYVGAGGDYNRDRLDVPITQQGARRTGDTSLGEGVWLGARATVLGGVTVGRDSIVGAGSLVMRSVPQEAICVGTPARVVKWRRGAPGNGASGVAASPAGAQEDAVSVASAEDRLRRDG